MNFTQNSSIRNSLLSAYNQQHLKIMLQARVTVTIILITGVVLGTFGNFLVLKYFWKKFKRKQTASLVLVMTIACIDFFTCAVLLPCAAASAYVITLPSFFKVAYRLVATCCAHITLLFIYMTAWERYIAVCRAARYKSSLSRMLAICTTATVFGVIFGCLSTFPVDADMLPWASQTGILSRYKISHIFIAVTLLTVLTLYILMLRKLCANAARLRSVAPIKDQRLHPTGEHGTINELRVTRETLPPLIDVRVAKDDGNPDPQQNNTSAFHGNTFIFTIAQPISAQPSTSKQQQRQQQEQQQGQERQAGQEQSERHQQPRLRRDTSGYVLVPLRSSRQSDRLMLLTLFLVSLTFILSWFPASLAEWKVIALNWRSLAFLNNVFDPWIYFVTNKQFRTFSLAVFKP